MLTNVCSIIINSLDEEFFQEFKQKLYERIEDKDQDVAFYAQ